MNALTGAARPRAEWRRYSVVNSGVSGSLRCARSGTHRAPRHREQVPGPEPARIDVYEAVSVVEVEQHRGCAAVAPAGRTAASRSCAGASAGNARPTATRPGTCRARSSRSTRAPWSSASIGARGCGRVQRGSRISARAIVRPVRCGASWRRIVSTSGSSGIVTTSLPQTNASPGSSLLPPSVSQARTLAPTSASTPVVPAPAVAGERGQQRDVLASVVGVRGGRIAAVVGGQHQQIALPEQLEPLPHRRVDLLQGAVEPRDVVAVAVDLIGLHEIGEHEPGLERAHELGRLGQRAGVGGARMLDVDADAGEQLPDLAHGVHLDPRGLELVEVAARRRRDREVAPAFGALHRPLAPVNGRAITRPTACSAGVPRAPARRSRTARPAPRRPRARRSGGPSPDWCRRSARRSAACSWPHCSIASIPLQGRLQITPRPLIDETISTTSAGKPLGYVGSAPRRTRPSAPSARRSSPCPARARPAVRAAPACSAGGTPSRSTIDPSPRRPSAGSARPPASRRQMRRACSCPCRRTRAASGSAPTPQASSTTTNASGYGFGPAGAGQSSPSQ